MKAIYAVAAQYQERELFKAMLSIIAAWDKLAIDSNFSGPTPVWIKELKAIARAEGRECLACDLDSWRKEAGKEKSL